MYTHTFIVEDRKDGTVDLHEWPSVQKHDQQGAVDIETTLVDDTVP